MKTSTAEKMALMKSEFKAKRSVLVRIAGIAEEFCVKDVRSRQANVELLIDRGGGRMVVDPDDIRAIRLHEAI